MGSQFAAPILINKQGDIVLERISLSYDSAINYDENWLQSLLFSHPQSLPIDEIDQSYKNLVPVCRELNTSAGPIDVLYATPEGKLVILEAKLWRNPEARRKVIGQILDYAKELGRWSYEDLQREVSKATRNQTGIARDLFSIVSSRYPDLSEAEFIDSVARNLKRGEFLLLIVGDGIREGVAAIAEFLENHGTLHFTFGLVEMAIYKIDDNLLVQPRVIAQTTIIRRTVITLESEGLIAKDAAEIEAEASGELSESQKFYLDFWREFVSELKFDDQGQPLPNATVLGNINVRMPARGNAWITIYFSQKDKEVGVFLTFSKGSIGDMLYQKLFDDRENINNDIGVPIEWRTLNDKHVIVAKITFPDLRSTIFRKPIKDWLSDRANRFVNAFRPRIERIMSEE